ncbi:MAG: PKD domain-containing protein [Desulfobacteraceae bacterium]|nr:PKD domain-containing protein [Desulfobacteraceae bacterium]
MDRNGKKVWFNMKSRLTIFSLAMVILGLFVFQPFFMMSNTGVAHGVEVLELTMEQKRAILDAHNEFRRKCANGESGGDEGENSPKTAANMQYMFWDEALEEMAKKRAANCYAGHFGGFGQIQDDFDDVKDGLSFTPTGLPAGENVALYKNVSDPYDPDVWASAVEAWYDESDLYDWETNTCYADTCGHWAQVCSGETRYVGCAVSKCPDGIIGDSSYDNGGYVVTCNYWPSVNLGQLPFHNGFGYNICYICRSMDTSACSDNMCKGGKNSKWHPSGMIDETIDLCTDGLGRKIKPCYPPPEANARKSTSKGSAPLTVYFHGNYSSDRYNDIVSYIWDFGDGTTDYERITKHTYTSPGTYPVTLTVINNSHQIAIESSYPDIIVQGSGNKAPTIVIDHPYQFVEKSTITLDASKSADSDGSIVTWQWQQINGPKVIMDSQNTATPSFTAPDTSLVKEALTFKLTITDNNGASTSKTILLWIDDSIANNKLNQPPIAEFNLSTAYGNAPLTIFFNASASSDLDGTIASYVWDFGNGETGTGETTNHTFTTPGTYVIYLTVTDNDGDTHATIKTLTVLDQFDTNNRPVAKLIPSERIHKGIPATLTFSASQSFDPDGSIVSYEWGFGDGQTGTGKNVSHTYTNKQTYLVTLVVTDDKGAINWVYDYIYISNANPIASFTPSQFNGEAPLTINFDASASWDKDGSISSYKWDFGNSNTASGKTASYTYTDNGTFIVKLTVRDNDQVSNNVTKTITVSDTPPENQSPLARFLFYTYKGPGSLSITLDASFSNDPDGAITTYDWDFGDGETGSGLFPGHTFTNAGTYAVKLTVTDNHGATDATISNITVQEPVILNRASTAAFTLSVTSE